MNLGSSIETTFFKKSTLVYSELVYNNGFEMRAPHMIEQSTVGILVLALGVAMGSGLAWCSIGTSEPDLARTSCCSLGRITL